MSLFTDTRSELSLDSVRDRLATALRDAFRNDEKTLIEALPAMGKSYGVVEWAEDTGRPLTVFTARSELYGQYEDWCVDRGLSHRTLPAFHRECGTIDHERESPPAKDSIEAEVREVYASGISGAQLHRDAERYFGERLPSQHDGRCPYMESRDFSPENYDVLIGHYLQAHNRDYLEDRYVAFDEFPGDAYFFTPTHNEATRAIRNYLNAEERLPFKNWKDLIRRRNNDEHEDAVREWKDDLGFYSHRDTRVQLQRKPGFHAHAPLLTHAGLEFELLDNEWEYANLGSGRKAVRSPEDEWTVLIPPPLYAAESVVALDGTPTLTKWRLVLGGDYIVHEPVLNSDREKREYLRDVLGLEIIQTDGGAKPYQSGNNVNVRSDGALLENIHSREGHRPSVITSKQAKEQYESTEVDGHIEVAEHYGNLKGSNEFEETRLGVVIGSPHPPEGEAVQRWGALNGDAVERKTDDEGRITKGVDLDFGPLGNALFRDVAEYEVLQAVMRFGRTESDGKHGARVYVHTSRLPRWVEADERVDVTTWSKGMQEVVEALRSSEKWPDGEWTNGEIAESVSVTTRQVGELMKELDEEGYVTHRRGGRGNAYHWSNERLEDFSVFGRIE
ncbi:hypothetical protein GCM10009037_03320 [Halarchaeum grantii]|uniref:Uncharacterized protein n=1 Tax=Halarchaeum grantii TaxID=1193105 RepID=A0A830F646_9EURY|nr:hypothetical protein [Halarchaeum grantii]GGL23182.1 hypothetical protein GCM10009037_03320 [Halarchaeum grantii]